MESFWLLAVIKMLIENVEIQLFSISELNLLRNFHPVIKEFHRFFPDLVVN